MAEVRVHFQVAPPAVVTPFSHITQSNLTGGARVPTTGPTELGACYVVPALLQGLWEKGGDVQSVRYLKMRLGGVMQVSQTSNI